jgi:ABC-type transport system involved in cytochrome c biogenesis permease subunit
MTSPEAVFFWLTALCMAVALFLSILSLVMRRAALLSVAFVPFVLGFVSLTVFEIIRWIASGHPPFVSIFESMTTAVWFLQLLVLLVRAVSPRYTVSLLPAALFAMLLLGWSSSLASAASPLSAALDSVWLFIHASFATSGAASFLAAASLGSIYLLGPERLDRFSTIAAKIPEPRRIPAAVTNFVLLGLILWGVMIVSGSIWAHNAWGRYWAWDPIELWSLISWLLFALLLHARIGFKISPRLFCWLTIVAAATVVFSLWGVRYVYTTIHSYG